jgi:hypothetical protein
MANFTRRASELLHSPRTQGMISKVKEAATRPENRAKVRELSDKVMRRGHTPRHEARPGQPRPPDDQAVPPGPPEGGPGQARPDGT